MAPISLVSRTETSFGIRKPKTKCRLNVFTVGRKTLGKFYYSLLSDVEIEFLLIFIKGLIIFNTQNHLSTKVCLAGGLQIKNWIKGILMR